MKYANKCTSPLVAKRILSLKEAIKQRKHISAIDFGTIYFNSDSTTQSHLYI
jgi:hypothetical protein